MRRSGEFGPPQSSKFWPDAPSLQPLGFLPAKARVVVKTGAASRPRLGQHFLRDAGVRDRVLAAVPADGLPLLEVGPGDGALTEALASLGRPLVAVELDEGLAALLQRRLRLL